MLIAPPLFEFYIQQLIQRLFNECNIQFFFSWNSVLWSNVLGDYTSFHDLFAFMNKRLKYTHICCEAKLMSGARVVKNFIKITEYIFRRIPSYRVLYLHSIYYVSILQPTNHSLTFIQKWKQFISAKYLLAKVLQYRSGHCFFLNFYLYFQAQSFFMAKNKISSVRTFLTVPNFHMKQFYKT